MLNSDGLTLLDIFKVQFGCIFSTQYNKVGIVVFSTNSKEVAYASNSHRETLSLSN